MTTSEASWGEVGADLGGLALKLKLHMEQATSATTDELERSLRALREALDETFQALRDVAGDEALQADVRDVGGRLSDAIFNTLSEVRTEVERARND